VNLSARCKPRDPKRTSQAPTDRRLSARSCRQKSAVLAWQHSTARVRRKPKPNWRRFSKNCSEPWKAAGPFAAAKLQAAQSESQLPDPKAEPLESRNKPKTRPVLGSSTAEGGSPKETPRLTD